MRGIKKKYKTKSSFQTGRIRFFLRRFVVVETMLDTEVIVVSDFVESDTIDEALLGVFEKK